MSIFGEEQCIRGRRNAPVGVRDRKIFPTLCESVLYRTFYRSRDRSWCMPAKKVANFFWGGDLSRSGTSFGIKKHSRAYKPGSVPAAGRQASAIYLRLRSPAVSSDLPPGIGRATLMAPVYMVLQPVRRTAGTCRHFRGGLLPRLFTLTLKIKAVVFCYAAMPLRTSSR